MLNTANTVAHTPRTMFLEVIKSKLLLFVFCYIREHMSTYTGEQIQICTMGRKPAVRAPLGGSTLPLLRCIPGTTKWVGGLLTFEPTLQALQYVRSTFPAAKWTDDALAIENVMKRVQENAAQAPANPNVRDGYVFRTKPYEHQRIILQETRDRSTFALFMEQGTGKTKVILDNAAYLWAQGKIQGLLVLAYPNGAHVNWVANECPVHIPLWCSYVAAAWDARRGNRSIDDVLKKQAKPTLRILTMNIEAMSTKRGEKIARDFLTAYPSLFVVDESTCIKTPSAKRTRAVLRLASLAPYRRILTGTPVTKGPLDLYTQFGFLDEEILGFSSFYSYRAHYAVMRPLPGRAGKGGRPIQIVVGYQNTDELQRTIAPHSFRVLKKDCLDLPEKIYQRAYVEMTDEQWEHYENMKQDIRTEFEGRSIAAPLAITRLLRLHQIACGFLPDVSAAELAERALEQGADGAALLASELRRIKDSPGVPINKINPRLTVLMEMLENVQGKAIIWANYRFNLREIWTALVERYGRDSVVAYHGGVTKQADRTAAVKSFQDPHSPVRWFVGQPQSAGYSLTLTAAEYVFYYSNNHMLEVRLQSEDRAHRIGQTKNVVYVDLEARDTVDTNIIVSLRAKLDVASSITGDSLIQWLA